MRVILVPVANRPECTDALNIAFDLANRLDASLCGCHIRAHSDSDVELRVDSDTDHQESIAARQLFCGIAERLNYPLIKHPRATAGAMWLEKVGSPDKVLSIMGPVSDLIVVSRPASKTAKSAHKFLYAALLNTSRPVLVLPQSRKSMIARRISIAWNQSPEAAQAVSAAMPLLRLADEVNIITSGTELHIGPKSGQLKNYLRFWGVKSNRVRASGADDAKAILNAYRDSDSDLLVMGAYSRSRLRERMFGGVTEFMLHKTNIPIFMLHS